MATNLPRDFKSWLSASHLSPAKPCFLWCQQPQRWSRFTQEELRRRVLSFSDLVEELKTEVSENPIPTGKVQKRHVASFMCVLHLSTFSRSTIWQEAFQQEPRLTKTQIMGQSSILMGKERLCYHFLLWLDRHGHTHLQSQDSGGLERWRSSWATDETILYPRMACWREVSNVFSYVAMSSHLETLTFPSLVFKPHAPSSVSIRESQHVQDQGTLGATQGSCFFFFFKPLESDGIVSDSLAYLTRGKGYCLKGSQQSTWKAIMFKRFPWLKKRENPSHSWIRFSGVLFQWENHRAKTWFQWQRILSKSDPEVSVQRKTICSNTEVRKWTREKLYRTV